MLDTLISLFLRLSRIIRTMRDLVSVLVLAVPALLLVSFFSYALVSGGGEGVKTVARS